LAGKTVVLVAHRLSTVKDADVIYVLQDGQIVEQGNHRQLIAHAGKYASLWQAQTEGLEPPMSAHSATSPRMSTNTTTNGNGRMEPCVAT